MEGPFQGQMSDELRTTGAERRYVGVNQRMSAVNGMGAALITALTLFVTFGQWRIFATIAITQVVIIVFNVVLINAILLPRWGTRRAEVLRAVVNIGGGVLLNHVAGWPLPAWLFLPYVALVFDHLGRRTAVLVLAGTIAVNAIAATLDGVAVVYPIVFSAFAVFCSVISAVRFRVIRTMLVEAEEQGEQLRIESLAREKAEEELRRAQKLEAVGRLAAGIAHEINTPIQFVGDSVHFIQDATTELIGLIDCYRANVRTPSQHEALAKAETAADLPLLRLEVPKAVDRTIAGLSRVAGIVRSMRDYSHPDQKEMEPTDLNHGIRLTLTIARHEYKDVADVDVELGELPLVVCHAGEINQVVLNLLVNASHAIADRVERTEDKGRITVRTYRDGGSACIEVADTGAGIPAAVRDQIFDPFFTTKVVGRGTGQGLSMARQIVIAHGGTITCESIVGVGTKFVVRLPVVMRATG